MYHFINSKNQTRLSPFAPCLNNRARHSLFSLFHPQLRRSLSSFFSLLLFFLSSRSRSLSLILATSPPDAPHIPLFTFVSVLQHQLFFYPSLTKKPFTPPTLHFSMRCTKRLPLILSVLGKNIAILSNSTPDFLYRFHHTRILTFSILSSHIDT